MAECPNVPTCRMFAVFKMANALEVWKLNYCTHEYQKCERFKLNCKGETVPDFLLPNGKLLKRP